MPVSDLRPRRALVVDDSATMRGFVTLALEADAYETTHAASGFEALKLLPRADYDVIITDINMPDINGLELVRFVRESDRHATTPLVIISTDAREVDRARALKLGADAFLAKPFAHEELRSVVRRVTAGGDGTSGPA